VSAGRELLRERIDDMPRLRAIVGDRAYRGLAKVAAHKRIRLDIKAKPAGTSGFTPIAPLYKIEHAFAQLGRWRRLSRCYEGSQASARAWLEVASVGYLARRAVVRAAQRTRAPTRLRLLQAGHTRSGRHPDPHRASVGSVCRHHPWLHRAVTSPGAGLR
ncbi:MAG: hypothetical protein ACRDG7_01535, partial [Candidatus Limnocylindria bacterium]